MSNILKKVKKKSVSPSPFTLILKINRDNDSLEGREFNANHETTRSSLGLENNITIHLVACPVEIDPPYFSSAIIRTKRRRFPLQPEWIIGVVYKVAGSSTVAFHAHGYAKQTRARGSID